MNQLHSRYNQSLDDNLKLAILVGMLPKEFQDLVFQNGTGEKDMKYIDSRAFVLRIAHQRAQMARPVPVDVGQVWGHEDEVEYEEEGQDVNVTGKGGACHNCGGM